jgi:hypothetical protein
MEPSVAASYAFLFLYSGANEIEKWSMAIRSAGIKPE